MAEIDSILDNQEVTAQTLNDIAVDLGHTSFNGFGENKFGAYELNGITGALVSAGILSSDNKCRPYISDNKVHISTGTIVFANGSKKKITEEIELDLIASTYIYALNNTAHNKCEIVVSEVVPIDGDFVSLAEISANRTLNDRRMIAKAKVELPTEGNSFRFKEEYFYGENINTLKEKTITIPIKGVSKIFISAMNASLTVFDINSQSFSGVYKRYNGWYQYINDDFCYLDHRTSGSSNQTTISLSIESLTEEKVVLKHIIDTNGYYDPSLIVDFYVFGGVER